VDVAFIPPIVHGAVAVKQRFATKAAARQAVWDRLQTERLAAFPFPPHGRIPNFTGAKEAAARLFTLPIWRRVKRIKANPDAPQRYVREEALRRGIEVLVPTARLRGGFMLLDPKKIPPGKVAEAASLSKGRRWAEAIPLEKLPRIDAIVTGSVAVTRDGRRCGKGEGYSDLEFAILRELGHRPVPVMTTVHDVQVVQSFTRDDNDIPLSIIATPTELIRVRKPPPAPRGIDWQRLTERDYQEMPVLAELRSLHRRR
jgi:5-formyltetrahydrofolate cyclo-ligase